MHCRAVRGSLGRTAVIGSMSGPYRCFCSCRAGMWAASGKWGALAGRATPLLVEMGRRSLDLRNGFREMAWNRGGAVPLDAIAWLLASVAPTAAPHALRCLLAAIDARMGGATEAVTYEQLRETSEGMQRGDALVAWGRQLHNQTHPPAPPCLVPQ